MNPLQRVDTKEFSPSQFNRKLFSLHFADFDLAAYFTGLIYREETAKQELDVSSNRPSFRKHHVRLWLSDVLKRFLPDVRVSSDLELIKTPVS